MKYIILLLSAVAMLSCQNTTVKQSSSHNQHGHDDHDHDHDHEVELGENEVQLKNQQARLIGLKMEKVEPRDFFAIYKTTGQIKNSLQSEFTVTASTSGIINFDNRSLNTGVMLQQGGLIGTISSKNLLDGDPAEKSLIAFNTAKSEFERAQILIEDSLISRAEYNQIKLNFEQKTLEYEAVSKQLTQNGIKISSNYSGYIKEIHVNNGDYVQVGQAILTLTQNKKIQLVADVSEKFASSLAHIHSANFKGASNDKIYELENLSGKLLSYGRSMQENSPYIPVIFELNNESGIIPGSWVEVYIKTHLQQNSLTVLNSSLIEELGNFYVYVSHKSEIYTKTPVILGQTDGIRTQIISGINSGDKVVALGAYHLKMAGMSSEIPHGHTH